MQRLEMCVDRRLWAGMMGQAELWLMMTSEVGDNQARRRHKGLIFCRSAIFFIIPHRMPEMRAIAIPDPMTLVSVCLSVCAVYTRCTLQKPLNELKYCLGADTWGRKKESRNVYRFLYCLEVCNLDRSTNSLDFTLIRFFMKLFWTSDIEIIKERQSLFGCELPTVMLRKRLDKFLVTYTEVCIYLSFFYYDCVS